MRLVGYIRVSTRESTRERVRQIIRKAGEER